LILTWNNRLPLYLSLSDRIFVISCFFFNFLLLSTGKKNLCLVLDVLRNRSQVFADDGSQKIYNTWRVWRLILLKHFFFSFFAGNFDRRQKRFDFFVLSS